MSESRKNKVSMALYYRIIDYIKDLDETKEILVNPKINNELESPNGIYSIISLAFRKEIFPKRLMKIKFGNFWYPIYDINIYNFCVSGNLAAGDNILIKIIEK